MKKKILFFLIILISICALSNVCAAEDVASDISDSQISAQVGDSIESSAADDTYQQQVINEVKITGNTHKLNSDTNNFGDIQKTIDQADEGDTIELNGTFRFNRDDNVITINKTMTIRGADDGAIIILGDNIQLSSRFFNIDSMASNVIFDNLKFQSKNAIIWKGDKGVINNCQFINGNSNINGTLVLQANNCNISNCIFRNNNAYQYGGAIVISGKDNLISSCNFYENHVTTPDNLIGSGGAIYSSCENLIIDKCNFTGNKVANGNGGAIAIMGKDNTISNCQFEGNSISNSINHTSIIGGGAIYSGGEGLKVDNCDFKDNKALGLKGGAICSDKTNTIENSYFDNNLALKGNDISSDSFSHIRKNIFMLENDENKADAVYGIDLEELNRNNFTVKKVPSRITFISTGMIFEYGDSGSITMEVYGGTVKMENIKVLNHPEAKITLSNKVLTISNLAVGKYVLHVTATGDENHTDVDNDLSITVNKATAAIKAQKITVALKSGSSWAISIVDSRNNKPIANMGLTLKVKTGKNYKTVLVTTNSKGIAYYKTKGLSKGTHEVIVSASHAGYKFNTLKSSITVVKQKALKFKLRYKEDGKGGSIRSFIVLNKKTKKAVNGVKVKVLIYTGKKYKTYTLKSKKQGKYNGAIGFATNDFSAGKHKVVLKPVNIKYKGSFTTSFKLKKSATKGPKFFRVV